MKEQFVLGDLKCPESLSDSETSSISLKDNTLILRFDDICPPTPEMNEYQTVNGITRKLKAEYHIPVEPDFWTARVQLVYDKKKIFRPKVIMFTLPEFVEMMNKLTQKFAPKATIYMEVFEQFFNETWCVIQGFIRGRRNNDKMIDIGFAQLEFYCDKIEYDWETVKEKQ